MTQVYLGIGSNLGDSVRQVQHAIEQLSQLPSSRLVASSSLYRTAPVGPQDQPDFINTVVALETQISPIALLDAAQQLEKDAGRKRLRHWGERTLDVDILLYGDQVIHQPRLDVPHPQMTKRAFVLFPLVEIAPHLVLPDGSNIRHWADGVLDQPVEKLVDC